MNKHTTNVVYYIGVPGDEYVKIGTTKSLQSRLKSLSTARHDGDKLAVLATEPGSYELEQRRHAQFSATRSHGEWFRMTPALKSHIDMLSARSHPSFTLGYDEGYQAGLSDRGVLSLVHCVRCDEVGAPAWDDSDDDEPVTICTTCRSEEEEASTILEYITMFMEHFGVSLSADGFVALPLHAQRALTRLDRNDLLPSGAWVQMMKEAHG